MNDTEILTNYLSLLKSNVEVYVHGTIESSNPFVKDVIRHGLDDTLDSQDKTYSLMVSLDMYTVNNVKSTEVKKVYNKIKCQNE